MTWRGLHLALGTAGLFLFILQGQYMARVLGVPELPDVQRMLYRSAHLYLMLACAANICAGYFIEPGRYSGFLPRLCSVLLLVSPVLLLVSFFTEVNTATIDRPLLSIALYLLFAAVALLASHALWRRFRPVARD
ncbi:MAG: hypothetical protein CME59_03055 [Halioglobus sp.]|nr:hypothetical protein [Halioglobus sp.]|tara:strand:+ start:2013 stop:2417 length:405 start_codon:yes stop_codon:yes gene_type:complete